MNSQLQDRPRRSRPWWRHAVDGLSLLGPALLAAALTASVGAAAPQPVNYVVDLRNPPTHQVAVVMTVPDAPPDVEIQFPAWNALYQIRDFVRNVQGVAAQCDGRPDRLTRLDPNTWRSHSKACSALEIRYSVYINEEGVFSSVLNPDHCFMNLAMVLFYLPHQRGRETRIRFLLPAGWTLVSLLEDSKTPGEYWAPNYDSLVDSPAEAAPAPKSAREGKFHEYSYNQNGATYRVVFYAEPADYSPDRLLASLQKITAAETALMHDVPFSRYTFLLHFPRGPAGGGMEHRNGTAISVSAERLRSDIGSLESVAAHEFFHAWNVKRIRPQSLEPIDYIHGNDTRDLWFSEGVTSTYGDLTLLRAGLISRQQFYQRLAAEIRELQRRPARSSQSVEESGEQAWLEKYADYLRPERSISYYNKGELLGFLLDLAIRHASGNRHSLDDVMRRLNADFARRGRFFAQADLREIIVELAPAFAGLDAFFRDYLSGVKELDYGTYLDFAGLRLATGQTDQAAPGFRLARRDSGDFEVESVDPGSNAEKAGLRQGDVMTQINGQPLSENLPPGETWPRPYQALWQMRPGQKIELRVQRGPEKMKAKFSIGSRHEAQYSIEELPSPTAEQLAVRNGWLEGNDRHSAESSKE